MDAARNRGGLRTNSFVRLRKLFTDGRPALQIHELGNAESILRNKLHFRETAQRLIGRGIVPQDNGWDGWLGRYKKAIADVAMALEHQGLTKKAERNRSRGYGR